MRAQLRLAPTYNAFHLNTDSLPENRQERMAQTEVTVHHHVGLHARPASQFVKLANKFPCAVTVRNVTANGAAVNAKSILSVLTLGVQQGHLIEIQAEGEQASEALSALGQLVLDNFGEA